MNEELLQKLYSKYNLSQKGSFDQFRNDMQSPDVQRRFFDKYNLSQKGAFETFQSDLGYKPAIPKEQVVGPAEMAPVSPEQIQRGEFAQPIQEAPGFFGGLARQAETTFGPQKEKSKILTELQQAPVDYNEYVNKQKILYDQTKVAAPVRYDMFQSNPVPTEQDFNTLSLDQIKKKYGTSEIANRTKGLMGDENRFSISVGSLLDQVASVPKEQQASTFKNLVNDALRKVREQQVYRKGQLEYQMERETAGIPQTFGEAVSRGELGTYIGSAIGGAAGSSAVALTKPLVGGYELTKGEILDMANKAKAESLGQTENEFIVSGGKLDSNSAVEVGSMVSSALEYVGLGKIAAPLFKNLVKEGMKSAMKKGIVEVGKGAAAEFSTEFVQSVNEQVSSQMAAGKKPEEIVINWDDALESGIQGGIGGGGLTTVSTVTSGLANAIAKRRKIEQIDNDINRLTDTGSPEINQQIDNELNLITPTGDLTYDQEGQIGVPSAEQQGAALVQEGAQPEGRGTETETGGVLQVSPETPGAQAEVTGIPVERKEIQVYRGTTTGNKSEKDGVSYYTPDRNYASFYESGTEKAQNVALQELQDLKEPTKPTEDTPISENNLLESLGDLGYKFNSASEVKNRIDELDSKQNPTLKERTEDLDLSILYAEYDPVKVDGMNKFKQGEYEKDLAEYNKKKSELESKAKSYLSPKKLSGNFFNLGVDFSSMNPQQIFERLQSLGIATEFKGGNFLDNYHSDLVEFARKNNIEFFDGITGGIVGSLNVKPQEIIEVSKIAETAGLGEQVTPATEDLEAEGLRELEQLEQPTPPQPTAEQPTVEQPTTEQPVTPQPEAPTTEQPANLNDFKRYFFNKDPKAFGGNLGTALGMSQVGWQKAYNKFAKTATPEEIRMLDALRGKEVAVQPQVEEQVTEEEVILIDKTALTNAGYTNEQIKLVEDNPEKFGQIDDKIVNLETNEVIKPTGKKKVQVRPKRRPKETFPKKTYADLEKAMFTPGVKLDELLRIVIGMNNDYSALAEQLLNIYKSNKTVRLAKFDTNRLSGRSESGAWGVYRSYNNTVAVFVNDIKEYWKNRAKVGKISPREVQPETESSVSRILLHEIVHAYTVKQIYNAIPAARSRNAEIRALQSYLKHGDNQGIKDIITLYLSARDQIKALEKKDSKEGVGSQILKEAGGTKAYGLKNIKEFLTEAFTQTEFQRLLNRLESPIAPKKSTWQSFVDAVKKILRIATTGAKELSPVKAGSILESVLRVAPDIMITDQEARTGNITEEVDMSPAPQDPRTAALIKIAQGLINKGATPENVIQQVKDLVTPKFNINVDAYAQDILAGINVRREAVAGPFNADTEVANVATSPYNQILTSQKPDDVSAADFKQQKVEAVADFLRGKATSKEQVQDFALAWNDSNPNNPISRAIANEAWDRLKTARPQPAATTTVKINDMIRTQAQIRAKGKAEGVRETTKQFREKLIKMVQDAIKASNLTRNQINSMLSAVKRVNLFTPGSINKLADRIAKLETDAAYADKVNLAYSLKSKLKNPPSTIPPNIQNISKKLSKIEITDDTIDEYIEKASSILSSFVRPDIQGFSTVKVLDIEIFIDNYYRNLEKEMVADLLNVTLSKENKNVLDELVNPDTQQSQQDILNNLVEENKKAETIANLQDIASSLIKDLDGVVAESKEDKESLSLLKKFDVKTENLKALVNFIRLVDNIVTNNDFSGVGKIESEIKAATEVKPTIEAVKKYKKTAAGISTVRSIWLGITASLQNIAIKATAAAREANILNNFLGLAKYEELSSQATQRVNKVEKGLDDKITALDKKYKTKLMSNEEQIKFTILSELAKYVNDPTVNINQIVNNIESDIKELLDSNKKYATKVANYVYGVIDNMYKKESIIGTRKEDPNYPGFMFKDGEVKGSAAMVESYFEKNEPAVYELWKYFTENVFTDQLFKESEKVYAKYYNGILNKSKNYIPTSFRKIGEGLPEDAFATDSYSPQPNKRYKEANRGKRSGYTYSYVQSIRDAINAYREITTDNLTMPAQFQFNAAISRPELKEIMDGELRDFYIKDYKTRTNRTRSVVDGHLKETQIIFDLFSRGTKNIMNVTKLFSIRQIAQQFIPALTSITNLLGPKYVKYLGMSVPKEFDEIIKMTSLGEGSLEEGILNLNNSFNFSDEAAYNTLIKALNKIQNKTSKLTVKALDPVIGKPDMNIRRRGWRAFYFKRLDELGVSFKDIDLKTEIDKQDDPKRIEARTYASFMIQKTMAPTTKFSKAEIWKQKGIMNAVVNNYLPFGSFMINYKNRIVDAMSMISNGNIEEGEAELRAAVSESLVFSTIQILWANVFTVPLANALYAGIFGVALDEEEEDEILFFTPTEWKQFWTNIVTDVNPAAISDLSNVFIDFGNYMTWLSSDSNTTFDEWLEDKEAPSIFKKQTFEPVGYFGMAARDAQDMYYGVTNLYNTTKEDGVYRIPNYLYKDSKLEITEDVMKLAQWDLVFKTVGNFAPGELKSAWRMVKKEEVKYQKEQQKSKNK